MRQISLQNAAAILLRNATEVYYKMRQVFYYKMRQFYYKMQQLLLNATILLQNATVITKCNFYYKLRQYRAVEKDPDALEFSLMDLTTQMSMFFDICAWLLRKATGNVV